ncbi:hypothetical protein [Streptomyces sp. FH025]|uniref:hypothetical protein n=1 Tax=Streptomyces sp. FH025 TaxID=2815937 RepID=UPI001A9FC2A3|nr:hypothetical protein [Streptomyces sp. FH025]MBO1419079.1 hypothetical protein [Streptomyces sp. FH025]
MNRLAARLAALIAQFEPEPPTPYVLRRDIDVSGVSGTGVVAEGVIFSAAAKSTGATRWRGERGSTVAWDHAVDVESIHGHDGATSVVLLPVPAMLAALSSIAELGRQRGSDEWARGWNEALRAVHGLVERALDPHLAAAEERANPVEGT